jgi:DNA-binding MarR family transcriptional regulator
MSSHLPDTDARRGPENLAILLREPFLLLTDRLMRRLADRGHPQVRAPHRSVFEFLDDGGTQVSTLAERAGVTKQSMAELVAHLERHTYVERLPDPVDGRAKLVVATARGREVFAIARELIRELQLELDSELGAARVAQLRALLIELSATLERTSSPPRDA